MSAGPVKVGPTEQGAAPLNFIYACSICCASFADAYEGDSETVQGLSDGINPKERLVAKLYLANCCHVFCGSHLEGGAPPFHPAGQRPKAPCPVCIKEKGGTQPRDLFSIRGFNKDEYDPQIPPSWFTAPPIRLDSSGKEMEALRFQYIALIRYCQNSHATRKSLQKAVAEAEQKLLNMKNLASEEHAKVLGLEQEIEQLREKQEQFGAMKTEIQRLQGVEQEVEHFRRLDVNLRDLETFTTNKTAIRHYLKLVPMLVEQNESMKARLAKLGFAMALEPVPNFPSVNPHASDNNEANTQHYYNGNNVAQRKTASSHTIGESAYTLRRVPTAPSSPFARRPTKRQRMDPPLPGGMAIDPLADRDAMPPPPKPMSRMRSVRKLFPAFRKNDLHGKYMPVPGRSSQMGDNVHIGSDGHWKDTADDQFSICDGARREGPYMSGALPTERRQDSRLLSSMGKGEDWSDFTFRASSPTKAGRQSNGYQPVQLPTEPSYIQLMNGLSHGDGIELGLKDPRESNPSSRHDEERSRQVTHIPQDRHRAKEQESQNRWKLGHPFLHQSPYGPSSTVNGRLNPIIHSHTNGRSYRPDQEAASSPLSPDPRRCQQPSHHIENVVSPFFRGSHRQELLRPVTGFAETQDSSNHFGAYRSRKLKLNENRAGLRERPSLNGLSFFDSPVNSRNEVIRPDVGHHVINPSTSSPYLRNGSFDPRGFITRPEMMRSPFMNDSTYESSQDRSNHAEQTFRQIQPTNSLSYLNQSPYSRRAQIPLRPSLDIGRSPTRAHPQWETLQRIGVRSSRHNLNYNNSSTHAYSLNNVFSSAGRRSVRR